PTTTSELGAATGASGTDVWPISHSPLPSRVAVNAVSAPGPPSESISAGQVLPSIRASTGRRAGAGCAGRATVVNVMVEPGCSSTDITHSSRWPVVMFVEMNENVTLGALGPVLVS